MNLKFSGAAVAGDQSGKLADVRSHVEYPARTVVRFVNQPHQRHFPTRVYLRSTAHAHQIMRNFDIVFEHLLRQGVAGKQAERTFQDRHGCDFPGGDLGTVRIVSAIEIYAATATKCPINGQDQFLQDVLFYALYGACFGTHFHAWFGGRVERQQKRATGAGADTMGRYDGRIRTRADEYS